MANHDIPQDAIMGDRYVIERVLGAGGMGVVYQALDRTMDRRVAIKILNSASESTVKRFEREAKVLARLTTKKIPEIYAWGLNSAHKPYMVMEFVGGETLGDYLAREKTAAPDFVCLIAVQVCQALAELHGKGWVHRDLKPSNIMFSGGSQACELEVKVMDLGIAHIMDADQSLTASNQLVGSIAFISPEHMTPKKLDARSDIFSLGCVMYTALQGHPPFEAGSALETLVRLRQDERDPLPEETPAYLKSIVNRCLKAEPEKRFQSVQELEDALVHKRLGPRTGNWGNIMRAVSSQIRKPVVPVVAAALFVVALLMVAIVWRSSVSREPAPVVATVSGEEVAHMADRAMKGDGLADAADLCRRLTSQSDHWWSVQSTKITLGLQFIGGRLLQLQQLQLGDQYFDLAERSLQCRHASSKDKRESLFVKLYQYAAVNRYTDQVRRDADRLVALTMRMPNRSARKIALFYRGQVALAQGQLIASKKYFTQALAIPEESDHYLHCEFALAGAYVYAAHALGEDEDKQIAVLTQQVKRLRMLYELDPAHCHYDWLSEIVDSALLIPESRRPPGSAISDTSLVELCKKSEASSMEATVRIFSRLLAGSVAARHDRKQGRQLLLGGVEMAKKEKKIMPELTGLNLVSDNKLFASPDEERSYLDAACRKLVPRQSAGDVLQWGKPQYINAAVAMTVCYRAGLAWLKTDYKKARQHFWDALHWQPFFVPTPAGVNNADVAMVLLQIADRAAQCRDGELRDQAMKQFEQVDISRCPPAQQHHVRNREATVRRILRDLDASRATTSKG